MNSLLELRHLRYFVAVAEELHFSKAAEKVFLTQPALSQQIKALEEIAGVKLFDRTQRKVRLTEAGQTLLHGARRTLSEADRSIHDARRAASTPRLSMGYVEYGFQSMVTPIIQCLLKQYPALRIERREITKIDIPQALQDYVIDFGIAMLPMEGPNISSRCIKRGRWQIVMPAEHPLSQQSVIALTSLVDTPLLMFARTVNRDLYDFVMNRFRRTGVEPNIVYETSQIDAGQNMVELGVGLWVVASHVIGDRLSKRLVARDLADFDEFQIGVAWRSDDPSDLLDATLNAIQSLL